MVNWSVWVQRACGFTQSLRRLPGEILIECNVAPPLTDTDADRLADRLPRGLAPALHRFLTTGSANCACHYVWTPPESLLPQLHQVFSDNDYIYGGARMCNASEFEDYQIGCQDWAEGFDYFHGEECAVDSALWHRCVPFMMIQNGDYLALDVETRAEDPPVAYLSHEGAGESCIISPSFERFAQDWEQLCYIGPEIWLLRKWFDKPSGPISPRSAKTDLLRSLLTATFDRG